MFVRRNIAGNPSLEKSSKTLNRRDEFFKNLDKLSVNKLSKKYISVSFGNKIKRKIKNNK